MRIEVWSDFNCPWCWLGKRHLERALEAEGLVGKADVRLRSFELSPGLGRSRPLRAYLEDRYGDAARIDAGHRHLAARGAEVGLVYAFDRAVVADTFDAHRVHHLAMARGKGPAVADRLFRARQGEGADLGDADTLARLAAEAGLVAAEVEALLAGDAFAAEVRADEAEAVQLGVRGVPFFVFDRRWALSGAQPVEVFREALGRAVAGRPQA